MRRLTLGILTLVLGLTCACSHSPTTREKLSAWRQGIWLLSGGGHAIYTDGHYFVLTASGDSTQANVYCGTSLIRYTEKGIARKQILRVRQLPGRELQLLRDPEMGGGQEEVPLEVDLAQFRAGTCTVHEGILYDSVIEETDEYILLATCNGDRERIYADGRSVYMPAGGGEFWAQRIETWGDSSPASHR